MRKFLLFFLIISSTELMLYGSAYADQNTVKDEGVDYGVSLVDGVKLLGASTDATTVPGYGGTNMPESNYYDSQNLNGMQTDGAVGMSTGTTSDASLYAYERSTEPKLIFSDTDPILLNEQSITTDAMLNPDVLTVKTGDCAIADVSGTETRIETCTAWMQPTTHTCNNTLDVDVTWKDITSCPLGTGFSQVQALHNSLNKDDYVYARAYCNPGAGDGFVDIQVDASDGDPADCTDWTNITVSTSQTTEVYSGAILLPKFTTSSCRLLPTFIEGACTGTDCNYTITYRQLYGWSVSEGDYECPYSVVDLIPLGFDLGGNSSYQNACWGCADKGKYCVYKTSSANLTFEKPTVTKTPTVTDTWNDGCGFLEAQLQ